MKFASTVILMLAALAASAGEPEAAAPAPDAKVYAIDAYGNRLGQAYVVKDGKVYETDRYGNRRGSAYATDRRGNRKSQAYEMEEEARAASLIEQLDAH